MADTENPVGVEGQPNPQGSYQLRERQAKLEGSHEQMDKRIDTSDNWMRHHSIIILTMAGIVSTTIIVSLIKIAFFTRVATTAINNTP